MTQQPSMPSRKNADRTGLRSALWLPLFDDLADPVVVARLAAESEEVGWHGVFVWDHLRWRAPVRQVADPWITLAAVATATERLRLGPMVTPLPRRRPAKLAKETATLDILSGGRLTLGVGLGGDRFGAELSKTGEQLDDRLLRHRRRAATGRRPGALRQGGRHLGYGRVLAGGNLAGPRTWRAPRRPASALSTSTEGRPTCSTIPMSCRRLHGASRRLSTAPPKAATRTPFPPGQWWRRHDEYDNREERP